MKEPMGQNTENMPLQPEDKQTHLYKVLARKYIGDSFAAYSMRPLRREVRRGLRTLRLAYEKAVHSGKGGFDEWMGDNYHLLVKEGEALLTDLRYAAAQPAVEKRPAMFRLFLDLIAEQGTPTAEQVENLVEMADKVRPLTVFELSQLAMCLKAALLLTAVAACQTADREEAERLIGVAVTGMRQTADMDFAELTEKYSIVERILSEDPAGIYPAMDEASREDYRRRVALAALREEKSEASIAADAVEKADKGQTERQRHVGTYLASSLHQRRLRGRWGLLCQAVLPLLAAVGLAFWADNPWYILLFYLPLWEILRPLIDHFLLKGLSPRRLPRLELEGVIPEEGRTVITVSTLLPAADKAPAVAAKLARLYNTNGRGAVQICLLADLKQAAYPETPRDKADITAMSREIAKLNGYTDNAFVLAVRPRKFSPTMKAYTGWERKRGALEQLARYIRDGEDAFLLLEGDRDALRRARYILALDSDTGMLLDTASRLVGTALHPANRPEVGTVSTRRGERRRVVRGYGVLTPRMELELESTARTPFTRVVAGLGGLTPYDTITGEVYMDCFSSGIYAGKGLLDIHAFLAVTDGAFPSEQVLSHDILEGCLLETGYVSDVEMTDGFPSSMGGWLDRLHRWVRGDWQNMPFLVGSALPLRKLDKWKLMDNLRRSVTPAAALLCLLLAPFVANGALLAWIGVLTPICGQLLAALFSLLYGGWQTLTGRYYSRIMPRALEDLYQALYGLIMLPATALTGLDAACRALWRLVTRKRMLEWVTAADAEAGKKGGWLAAVRRFWLSALAALVLIVFGTGLVRLAGLFLAALIPLSVLSSRPYSNKKRVLTPAGRERVSGYAAAAWRFYEELCTADEHDLPPDNLQESPVWRIAHRTSPTNIGMYLLCTLAAKDFGLIDTDEMLGRLERTIASVEKLEKWQGNLLNWYDTRTLRPLSPRYVSTVDSGNLACCLVALRQGLLELSCQRSRLLAERVYALYTAMDLRPLYNKRRQLFHIGLDPDTGVCSPSYYDLLMSESRMTGYFAIATRLIPKKHWGTLGRMLARSGSYVGPVSWTGTMFEYFMPRLLLPAYEGTMGYEALRFCLHCQKARPPHHIPWGISESGFYAFDGSLNYQYKAHGVPKLGLKRGLAADMVISPYSSFLTLTTQPDAALHNLAKLEKMGMTGRCGFYEAADFTRGRAAQGGYSIVRSYMAHHVGMSLLACANGVFNDVFVRRFMRDPDMARATELLTEKAPVNGAVFAAVEERTIPEVPGRSRRAAEEITVITPRSPRIQLLSGGEWMLAVTDTGAGISCYRGLDMHMRSSDLLRRPQGIYTFIENDEGIFSVTSAPGYGADCRRRVEFGPGYATFYADKEMLEAGVRAMVHPRLACEQRQLVVKNKSSKKQNVRAIFYLEPCLARREDAEAHPAFSRLFLSVEQDTATKMLLISRRMREGEAPVSLALGFLGGEDFAYEASREVLLLRPQGISSLADGVAQSFSSQGRGVPDSVAALSVEMEIPPRSQKSVALILAAAPTETEAASRLIEVRREGGISVAKAAQSPFGGVEADLAPQILPDLFYPPRMSREWAEAVRENKRGKDGLWQLGISGDYPIVLIEVHNAADASRAEPYMRLHRSLRMGGVQTELVIVYREDGAYDAPIWAAIQAAARDARCDSMLGERGGIHAVNLMVHGEQALAMLTAVCAHNGARDLIRPGLPAADYHPADIQPVKPVLLPAEQADQSALAIRGGLFDEQGFMLTERPRLPWCHLLANPVFGTLLSDEALGYSWAVNSRENKLTPWFNDTASDNRGEMLLIRQEGKIWDAVWGSRSFFSPDRAVYAGISGQDEGIRSTVTVEVPPKGSWKQVTVELENQTEKEADIQVAYYTEPVLGVNRDTCRFTTARWENGALYLQNAFSAVKGCSILTALGGADGCDCDRGSFLSGTWGGGTLSPIPDPCAAVLRRIKLPPKRREKVTFLLGFAASQEAASRLPALAEEKAPPHLFPYPVPILHTPDTALNQLCRWLPHQIAACRLYARTGFYQCGGAWGFRDQLQDSMAALWFHPVAARRQIIRCAAVQFEEGDVLHWWHRLPGSLRGVRTRCSDDLVWLPFVTAAYVTFTGDTSVLDTAVSWLEGDRLGDEEQERYFEPARSARKDTVFLHCVRALEKACTKGKHGLPLMGSGDWNDGMNQVGAGGMGESVWLAMFLAMALERFAPLCEGRGEEELASRFREEAAAYKQAAEACFDGDRFLRAYLDDGTPLGKKGQEACALDSLTQSYAVLCGMPPEKTAVALHTALQGLVDREHGVIRLFAPAFSKTDRRVGYITAYPAGVRENGGQYTHGAVWLAMALLEAGRVEEGVELLRILNPTAKYMDKTGCLYGGEPYALAGDVYENPDCPGRVGWSQYTGSAGWFYTAVMACLLGLHPEGDRLRIHPRLPSGWPGYTLSITLHHTPLHIAVSRGDKGLQVDGSPAADIPLDGLPHSVELSADISAEQEML